MRPARIQISLHIRTVWPESSLIAWAFCSLHAMWRGINKNPCYTGWMYRLARIFTGHTGLMVRFVVGWLNWLVSFVFYLLRHLSISWHGLSIQFVCVCFPIFGLLCIFCLFSFIFLTVAFVFLLLCNTTWVSETDWKLEKKLFEDCNFVRIIKFILSIFRKEIYSKRKECAPLGSEVFSF